MLSGVVMAKGETVSPYTVDFEQDIKTSAHDFKVASNWKHIVDKVTDDYGWDSYASYNYYSGYGVNDSHALVIGNQDSWDQTFHDYLVTPVVSGEVSLMVKANATSSTGCFIEFVKLNETGTAMTEVIKKFVYSTDFNGNDFSQLAITVDDPQRIGIRGSKVIIDDFSAASAEIEKEKAITILTAVPSDTYGTIYWNQAADGSVPVTFTGVTVKNTGEVDLVQGENKFSVAIINNKNGEVLGRTKVPQDLAIGATSEPFEVSAVIPQDKVSSIWSYSYASAQLYLQEDLQGSLLSRANSQYRAYESKFAFREKGSTSTSSLSGNIAFGMTSEAVSKTFEIYNDGTAPLQVTEVAVPEGYESDAPEGAFVVESKQSLEITITLPAETPGAHNGVLTINYQDVSGAEKTYTVNLSGNVLGATTWFTTFDDPNGTSNVAYPLGSIAESGIQTDYRRENDSYNAWLKSYTNSDYRDANNKFITPKLHFNAGESISFEVKKGGNSGSQYNLKAYISTDRMNWGEPLVTVNYNDATGEFVSYSATVAEAGDYYVGFANYGMAIDNIAGGEYVEAVHDIYFAKVTQNDKVQSGTDFTTTADIISPLETVAADTYTVKYFVGDNATVIESKELAANAKKTYSFRPAVAPESDQTAVYPTYYEFEFADGTKFQSPVKELTITNDPWFVFLKPGTTVNYDSQATNYTGSISFGVVNTLGLTQSFEILNWGTAPLSVKSVTVPEGFSVNFDSKIVASKERETLVITFSTENPGKYEGELTITYVDASGEDATFKTSVSGTMLDPTKWYAPFDKVDGTSGGEWPAGSLHQAKAELSPNSGNYALYCSSSPSAEGRMFITPLLKAEAGETLSFDMSIYSPSWPEGEVEVYSAPTRGGLEDETVRTNYGKWSGRNVADEYLLTSDYKTFSITVAEAGEYYFGFALASRTYVDNINGLTLVDVAHDVKLTSVEIPAACTQNKESIAKVSLHNIGLHAEADASYTVAAYVNGEKCAEVDGVEIPVTNILNDDTKVVNEVAFRSPKAGTYPVYVTVDFADGYSLASEPVDVTFAEETLNGDVVVGTPSGCISSPINLNYKNSEAVSLYTPAELGLSGGEVITSIVVKGYYSRPDVTTKVKVAYEFTDETSLAAPASSSAYDYSGMTMLVSDDAYAWPNGGSESEPIDMITIKLDTPIVYEAGKSLKMLFTSSASGYYGVTYFESSNGGQTYFHQNDGTEGVFTANWGTKNSPVLHLGLAVEPKSYTATVKDTEGNAVEGATVTLVSNDGDNVQYERTTGADGTCDIPVIQSSRTYDVTVKGAQGEAYVDGVCVAAGSLTADITLLPVVHIGAEAHQGAKDAAVVYMDNIYTTGFNAVAFPIDITAEEVDELFGENSVVLEFKNDEIDGNTVTVHFSEVQTMKAGTPYIVYVPIETTAATMYKSKAVAEELDEVIGTNVTFKGAAEPTAVTDGIFRVSGDMYQDIRRTYRAAGADAVVKPFEAYFTTTNPNVTNVLFDVVGGVSTGIEDVTTDSLEEDDVIYNLQGIRVITPEQGKIYIVNGKKVVVK